MQQDLLSRKSNVDQNLADFEKLSFEEQQRLIDQFKREDRDYGLRVNDQQFNQFDRNRTFDRGVYQDDRNFNRGAYEDNRNYERDVAESDRDYDYKLARDQIADERYKQEFDEDVRRYGLDYATEKAYREGQLAVSRKNAETSRRNSNLGREEFDYRKEQDKTQGSSDGDKYNYKQDPDFADEIGYIDSNPADALKEIKANSKLLIDKYTYDGYLTLKKQAEANLKALED
jgi:hypothetical protein